MLQDSVCVYQAGQVCAVHSSVQKEHGEFSATRPAPASTAPPVRHIQEPACANRDFGELSVNTCVVLVCLEKSAVVIAHHVSTPPPAITLQEIVSVCLDILDHCVNKLVPLVDTEAIVAMCAGAPIMQHVITRLVCASVLLDGLDQTALYCVKLGRSALTVPRLARVPQTIPVTHTMETVCVNLDQERPVNQSRS